MLANKLEMGFDLMVVRATYNESGAVRSGTWQSRRMKKYNIPLYTERFEHAPAPQVGHRAIEICTTAIVVITDRGLGALTLRWYKNDSAGSAHATMG